MDDEKKNHMLKIRTLFNELDLQQQEKDGQKMAKRL
jgi:hypothetical protein